MTAILLGVGVLFVAWLICGSIYIHEQWKGGKGVH